MTTKQKEGEKAQFSRIFWSKNAVKAELFKRFLAVEITHIS